MDVGGRWPGNYQFIAVVRQLLAVVRQFIAVVRQFIAVVRQAIMFFDQRFTNTQGKEKSDSSE